MVRTLLVVLALTLVGPQAAAQLDLPDQMRGPRRDSRTRSGDLLLPRGRAGELPERAPDSARPAELPEPDGLSEISGPSGDRAAALVAELAAIEGHDSSAARSYAAQLETLGEPGLRAAVAALELESPTALCAAARLILRRGEGAEREALWRRIEGRTPQGAASALLTSCGDVDPTFLTDGRLVTLLEHPQSAMRAAAARQLETRERRALLPSLMPALESDRTDTRERAIELVAGITDPAVVPLLMARLRDESAQVAYRAAELLAELPDDAVADRLFESVRSNSRLFRDTAYALVALVEREDRTGVGLLENRDVPMLLEGLRGGDPFVRGASAVALAGIGFRSSAREATAWLDREVPDRLLAAIVGDEFHSDFSSLLVPARRRLSLISGERFGADGPAWARWWAENGREFRARRAAIDVAPGDEQSLSLAVRGDVGEGSAYVLLGTAAGEPRGAFGEVVYVGPDEATALVRRLGLAGVFGAERLPGHYGGRGRLRTLEVGIAGQVKRFSFAEDFDAAWFDELVQAANEIRSRNRWQRYWNHERHATRRDFFDAERDWWIEPRTDEERDVRLKGLILDALAGADSARRDALVDELSLLCAQEGVLRLEDHPQLLALLDRELFFGARAKGLLTLAIRSLSSTPSGLVDAQLARELFDRVYALFDASALDGLEQVLAATDSSLALALASDPRPIARSVAARRLARLGGPQHVERLRELVEDEIEVVQASTVEAIGLGGLDELGTEVLVQARIGTGSVRVAALRAAGRLRVEGARDAMLAAMASSDSQLQRAAVEGLADLADPATAALMTSFLRRGSDSPHYAAARRGLLALGEQAWPELRQLALAERIESRREAALLLSEQGAPEAVPLLIQVLVSEPEDARVAHELAILTCIDYRTDPEPARSWMAWWDVAVQDSSLAWFRGAQERAGLPAAPPGSLEGAGNRLGAESLLETLAVEQEPLLVERAERELERLLGRPLERPADARLHAEWRALLRESIATRFP